MLMAWNPDPRDAVHLATRLKVGTGSPFTVRMMEDRGPARLPNTQFVMPNQSIVACSGEFAAMFFALVCDAWCDATVDEFSAAVNLAEGRAA